jgi:GT2 family glycosyltransferase
MPSRPHRARSISRHQHLVAIKPEPQRELTPVSVDIIILEWNRPDATIAAVQSALDQKQVSRRIWVVDQGSEPVHRAKLARFCSRHLDVHVHYLPRNIGVAAGRNFATRLGSAPYVVSLDNDAVFADELCVARAISRLKSQSELGAIAFRVVDGESDEEEMYWDYPRAYLKSDVASFEVTRFLGGGHALRREAFERAGSYDEGLFFGGEERDIAWRMIRHGYRLRLYRDLAVRHRSVTDSKLSWTGRRYYFTVRNTLYINHKFGAGGLGFARGAAGFMLRGIRNGLAPAAMRGIVAAIALSAHHSFSIQDKSDYALTTDMRRYIATTDHKDRESLLHKLRRQLTPLPPV